ncbi:MAG: carboxymuconolactone decarboxylase family protein [Betaproteobacteria bacterium]|nr:carboxymuconolactone decarboxylase family protein [Betaproteobacteria bacterium]
MPRIPMVEPHNEPAELREVFKQLRQTRGRVPGMYRTLAHRPEILAAHRAYFHAALDAGTLPRAFKEKIAYRVARLRGSAYCTGSHGRYALKHGVSGEELDAIARSDYRALDAGEAAALEFAEAMVRSAGAVGEGLMTKLAAHFSAKEIVEIAALVGIMDLACTLAATFGLQPD